MARTIEEIRKDIAFVKDDLKKLREMNATTAVALEDLYELYKELDEAREAANGEQSH